MKIYYTDRFAKKFKQLPKSIQALAIAKEIIFRQKPESPALKNHRLKGKLHKYYAFSVNYSYRIMFSIEKNQDVTFIDIGSHSIYE